MVTFYNYGDTVTVHILPAQFYDQAKQMLTAARNSGRRLETAYDLLKEQLIALSVKAKKADLVENHRYGYLLLSPRATAERGGKMIPYHGEIYIGVATYCRQYNSGVGVLTATTGWGQDDTVQVPEGMLLLELP